MWAAHEVVCGEVEGWMCVLEAKQGLDRLITNRFVALLKEDVQGGEMKGGGYGLVGLFSE